MDTLNLTLATHNVRRETTSRFFFKTYPYRVMIDADAYIRRDGSAYDKIDYLMKWRNTAAEMLEAPSLIGTTKQRNQAGYACIYFDTEADVVAFVDEFHRYIVSVSAPADAATKEAMSSDYRIMVRETLFWNKYRWSGVMKRLTDEQLEEIKDWLESFKNIAVGELSFAYSDGAPRIFFAEEDDFCMFSFAFRNRIARIEKALLKDEIAHDLPLAAEGAR